MSDTANTRHQRRSHTDDDALLAARRITIEVSQQQAPVNRGLQARAPLAAVIGSLAIGGAERIVLDWAQRERSRHDLHLCVIRSQPEEWEVPSGIRLVRCVDPRADLVRFAQDLRHTAAAAGFPAPRVLCHMTLKEHRDALVAGGVVPVPVLHNASPGWREPPEALNDARRLVAVSQACADELRERLDRDVGLIRHLPSPPRIMNLDAAALRKELCRTLDLPARPGSRLVAMVGGIKPQKDYPFALDVLSGLAARADVCLVIFGGPVGSEGASAWQALREAVLARGLQDRVRLPGFVAGAAQYLPAFDVLLNTSRYEGLSMATLEALLAHVPVVASQVGGQGELRSDGLTLLPVRTPVDQWAEKIERAWAAKPTRPPWAGFPAHRLWTLEHLVCDFDPQRHVIFVTANLNAGGAQRSLVNLVTRLHTRLSIEVIVAGGSTSAVFLQQLQQAGVEVARTGDTRDCFDHAEAVLRAVALTHAGAVCFWNADAKVKLLLAKVLPRAVKLVDVSPGAYAFEEMDATEQFQTLCGFAATAYYERLDRLVLKYAGRPPKEVRCPRTVVRNGVPPPTWGSRPQSRPCPRVIVNGRIAPSKFLLEIVQAMTLVWTRLRNVELHLLGGAEPRHAGYARQVLEAIDAAQRAGGGRTIVHGPVFDLGEVAAPGDVAVVLGHHQGCPNAVLEAMAHGLAVVANDSGGTRELVVTGGTGVLLHDTDPQRLALAILALVEDRGLRHAFARAAQLHVAQQFSMQRMVDGYVAVFDRLLPPPTE